MIKNNKFLIKKLDNIVVLGNSQRLKELIEINNSIGVKTLVITSSHQSKTIPKEIKQLTSLQEFYCYGNPLNNIKLESYSNNLQAVKEYLNKPSISLVDACKGFIMQEAFHFVYE